MLPLITGVVSIVGLILGFVALKQDKTNIKAKIAAGIRIAGAIIFSLLLVAMFAMMFV